MAEESAAYTDGQVKPAIEGYDEEPSKIILTPDTPFGCVPIMDSPLDSEWSYDVQARKDDESIVLWEGIVNTKNVKATIAQLIATGEIEAGDFAKLKKAMCAHAASVL